MRLCWSHHTNFTNPAAGLRSSLRLRQQTRGSRRQHSGEMYIVWGLAAHRQGRVVARVGRRHQSSASRTGPTVHASSCAPARLSSLLSDASGERMPSRAISDVSSASSSSRGIFSVSAGSFLLSMSCPSSPGAADGRVACSHHLPPRHRAAGAALDPKDNIEPRRCTRPPHASVRPPLTTPTSCSPAATRKTLWSRQTGGAAAVGNVGSSILVVIPRRRLVRQ